MTTKFAKKSVSLLFAVLAIGLIAGCSGNDVPVNLDEEIQVRDERISQLEEEVRQNQATLEMSQREVEEADRRVAEAEETVKASTSGATDSDGLDSSLLPPKAKAGQCFARVLVPPIYESTSERVLVRDASSSIEIVPAKFEMVEEQVLVKEAGEKLITVPATFKNETEKILIKPASTEMVEVPAVYETVTQKVLVTPAREYWKKGRGPVEKVDGATGEIMCLVKEEAVYKTVSQQVLKSEATTREVAVPAEYKTITRSVIDTQATTRTEIIPAEYNTVMVRKLVSPAREVRSPIEAEYRTMSKTAMVKPSYMEWRQVLCETNMNRVTVLEIQKTLKAKGFNPGPLDGIYGQLTQAAVNSFQDSKKLSRGALTYETVEALGLSF